METKYQGGAYSMQKFSISVNSEEELEKAVETIWQTLGVRGEIGVIPMEGKFKIDVISETDLTPLEIAQVPGKPV
jgi:hypothetical protein